MAIIERKVIVLDALLFVLCLIVINFYDVKMRGVVGGVRPSRWVVDPGSLPLSVLHTPWTFTHTSFSHIRVFLVDFFLLFILRFFLDFYHHFSLAHVLSQSSLFFCYLASHSARVHFAEVSFEDESRGRVLAIVDAILRD